MDILRDGPLRKYLREAPLRRMLNARTYSYDMLPIPPNVNPVEFVIAVAQGDWAKNAAIGWADKLGLTGQTREDLIRRMQVAYAAGATRASPDIAAEVQRRLGVPLGPVPPVPPPTTPTAPAIPRRGRPPREAPPPAPTEPTTVTAPPARPPRAKPPEEKPPALPSLPPGTTQQQADRLLAMVPERGSASRLSLISDYRRQVGLQGDPSAIIDFFVATGKLERTGRDLVRRLRPKQEA